ncbi:hypothetical protein E3N88_29658 [Mikania micrantha]|uniref:Uncharacterized protein n=1 Tax=Mikania micrantha TaxID=192012 RepID=A0A5N6MJH2_9ASTR|nr:hypothetical protein E3N88_29658 [Mikania micrantha]
MLSIVSSQLHLWCRVSGEISSDFSDGALMMSGSLDDDKKGVERSDLFIMAVDYGKLDDNLPSVEIDIQMLLHALHKGMMPFAKKIGFGRVEAMEGCEYQNITHTLSEIPHIIIDLSLHMMKKVVAGSSKGARLGYRQGHTTFIHGDFHCFIYQDYGKLDDNLPSLEIDIQMLLHALHKVATRDPCCQAQHMTF